VFGHFTYHFTAGVQFIFGTKFKEKVMRTGRAESVGRGAALFDGRR